MRRLWFLALVTACGAPPPLPARPPNAKADPPHATDREAKQPPPGANPCEGDDFGLPAGTPPDATAHFEKKRGTSGHAKKHIVATSHRLATEAGLAVLRGGGSAADAFVAATLVQDVVLPGVTSTAGLAGILVYEAGSKKLTYVHGGVADPIEPAKRYRKGDTAKGKLVLVPGAPAAYAEVVKRFGKKRFRELVEPAAKLAAEGFPLDALYAKSIVARRATLESSPYGRATFFRNGEPIAKGEVLELPAVAATLRSYGKDPTWFHRGAWARDAVAVANANGGALSARDFETYAVDVGAPMHVTYMGYDVYAGGFGGGNLLVALGALEKLRGGARPEPPTASADSLERIVRIHRATSDVARPLRARAVVQQGAALDPLVAQLADQVAANVRSAREVTPAAAGGTHSSAVVIVDDRGNVVVGTHTIETLNWGEGLFVGGIPLSTSAPVSFDDPATESIRMRTDPLSDTIVLKDGAPRAALAVYGTGLHPGDVQILDAVLARGADAETAILEPRVGFFQFDFSSATTDVTKNAVDPRFDAKLLCAVRQRGIRLERSMPGVRAGYVDTGFPTLVTMAPGDLHGMTPDAPHIEGVAAGD